MPDVEEVLEVGTKLFLITLHPNLVYNGVVAQANKSKVWVKWQPVRDGIGENFLDPMDYNLLGFVESFKGRLTVRKKSLKTFKDLL